MRTSFWHSTVVSITTVVAVAFLSSTVLAYVTGISDPKRLLDRADVVCKVRVLSVGKGDGTITDTHFRPPLETTRMLVRLQLVSVIKGSPPDVMNVEFPGPTGMVAYTELAEGEVCVVFVKGHSSPYTFVNPHHGKLAAVPDAVKHDLGPAPHDRLLAELVACVKAGKGMTKLKGIEELGRLGDPRASTVLRSLSTSEDVVCRALSYISRIRVGDPPDVGALLSFLNVDSSVFDRGDALARHGSSGYSISSMQSRIVNAIGDSVRYWPRGSRKDMSEECVETKLQDFDYVGFLRNALDSKAAAGGEFVRRELAGTFYQLGDEDTVPDLVRLLDDSNVEVRHRASIGLGRILKESSYICALEHFKENELDHTSHWKEWWMEHGHEFKSAEKMISD